MELEKTIRAKNQRTTRFDFLDEGHIYHAYYRQLVEFGEDAPVLRAREAVAAKIAESTAAPPPKKTKPSRIQTVSEKLIEYMKQIKITPDTTGKKMPQNEYHVRYPEVYPAFDLDVVQLTGQSGHTRHDSRPSCLTLGFASLPLGFFFVIHSTIRGEERTRIPERSHDSGETQSAV